MPGSDGSGGSSGRDHYGAVAIKHFESGPPPSKMQLCSVDDGEVYETVKEEEWLTRKKVTTTTTKNVETRTQRQVVLEDGQVVEDSGPIVTTDCKEDTVTQEVNANENLTPEGQEGGVAEPPGEDWLPVGGDLVVSEKTEHILNSHQVAENKQETEEVVHCGDVTNQEIEDHVVGRGDLRALTESRQGQGWELARPEKRVVHESARKWGTVNTEDVHETSRIKDGHVVTETERTTQQEQYDNESVPDSGSSLSDGSVHEETREARHNIVHTKDEDIVEYYGVPRGATLAQGVKLGEGMHVVSEDFHEDREGEDLDSLSERFRRARRLGAIKPKPKDTPDRTDALTRRPLDYQQEEETRKSETNRWLENHFGSESGRSGSSHNDLEDESGVQTAGGNVITITMSPRPATPEDITDTAPPSRRWDSQATSSQAHTSKAPPPPPPPKPTQVWTPPTQVSPRQSGTTSEEITDTMIAAARARLRSTGRVLDDNEQSTPSTSPPDNSGTRFSTHMGTSVNIGSYSSPPVSPTGVNRPLDDPVYSSRFRSGSPCGFTPGRLFSTPTRNSAINSHSPPDSPPPPLPSTPPPSQVNNVGRSQSFNFTNKNWLNGGTKVSSSQPLQSRMKEYRSEEQLDSVGHKTSRRWPPPQRNSSPEPAREPTPPPPPRNRITHTPHSNYQHYNTAPARSHRLSRTEISTQTTARDSATQTGPSPVPPPRTKRKNKPKTYYFGQESLYINSPSSRVIRSPVTTTTMTYTSSSRHNQSSPKVERRFKTTKTITPVVVATSSSTNTDRTSRLKNRSWHYQSMDELSTGVEGPPPASWTNTIDPRRRPRNYTKEPETQTLPKKLVNGTVSSPSPSKTYIFGGQNTSNRREPSTHLRRNHGGSLINVSLSGMSSPKNSSIEEKNEKQSSPKMNKPVIRSHSLNVKPAPLSTVGSPTGPSIGSGLSSHQRTANVYRSSPYLNLKSPNLIATIARSNSTRRTDEEGNDHQEQDEFRPVERYRQSDTSHNISQKTITSSHNINQKTNVTSHNINHKTNVTSHNINQKTNVTPHNINQKTNTSSHNINQKTNTTSHNRKSYPMVNGDVNDDGKRDRFMKGLLTTAPELFHFIHGEDDNKRQENNTSKTRQSPPESPPQLIRPPISPLTSPPATTTAPQIFTFGRGETGSLKRTPSQPKDTSSSNRLTTFGRQRESLTSNQLDTNRDHHTFTGSKRNSLTSQYHRNNTIHTNNGNNSLNRPKFNLKSSGGSILYSTSFRNRADPSPAPWGRRGSDPRDNHDIVGDKSPGNVTSNLTRDGAVLIPVRDWNSR